MSRLIKVPFETRRRADIASRVLAVDKELRQSSVRRELVVQEDGTLDMYQSFCHIPGLDVMTPPRCGRSFEADTVRNLRVSVNSFLELLSTVIEVMDAFDPEAEGLLAPTDPP